MLCPPFFSKKISEEQIRTANLFASVLRLDLWPHHTKIPNCHPESLDKIEYQTSLYQYSYLSCLESQPQNA